MTLQPAERASARPERRDFDSLFTTDKPVIFAFHGYPWLIHRLTYRRTQSRQHARARLQGRRHDHHAFDMTVLNDLDRFHLAMDVIDRVPRSRRPANRFAHGCTSGWPNTRAMSAIEGKTCRKSRTGAGRRLPRLRELAATALSAISVRYRRERRRLPKVGSVPAPERSRKIDRDLDQDEQEAGRSHRVPYAKDQPPHTLRLAGTRAAQGCGTRLVSRKSDCPSGRIGGNETPGFSNGGTVSVEWEDAFAHAIDLSGVEWAVQGGTVDGKQGDPRPVSRRPCYFRGVAATRVNDR